MEVISGPVISGYKKKSSTEKIPINDFLHEICSVNVHKKHTKNPYRYRYSANPHIYKRKKVILKRGGV